MLNRRIAEGLAIQPQPANAPEPVLAPSPNSHRPWPRGTLPHSTARALCNLSTHSIAQEVRAARGFPERAERCIGVV